MKKKKRMVRYGQVWCQISGEAPLRFLNLCRSHKISLYHVQKKEESYICAMSVGDFFQIRHLRYLAGVHIRVIQRRGIPFLLQKMERRAAFFLGTAIFGVLLCVCYGFIWEIRISGNREITDEAILRYLKTRKIACGMMKNSADPHSIAADLRNAFPAISWVSVERTGTILDIQVEEARKNAAVVEKNGDGSLYADREGRVISAVTRSGICMVAQGDYVYPGDLLVSGEIPILDDGGNVVRYDYCEADAQILLDIAYIYYDRVDYQHLKRIYDTPHFNGIQLGFGDRQFRIGADESEGEMRASICRFRLSESFVLPITLTIYETASYTEVSEEYSPEAAAELLQEHFSEYFEQLRKKVMRITENDVKIILYKDHAVAYGLLHTQEQTGALSQTEKSVRETERNDS